MPAGRPSSLTPEVLEKAKGYLATCIAEIPCKEGLALYLEVSRSSLYEWCKGDGQLNEEFSYIFEQIMAEQGKRLVNGGLYGRFNSTITKLMLSKHDYIEKHETDSKEEITHKFENMTDEQLDAAIKAREARLS